MMLAERMSRLGTETAFNVLARAKELEAQGRDIVHLQIGEPDFDTPANIIAAGQRALGSGYTHYTPAGGIMPLRETIADYICRTRGIPVDPQQVVVVPGGKPIIFFSIMALVEPGDEVVMPNPSFPIYESMVECMGGRPVFVPLREASGFGFDLDVFADSLGPKTKMVVLNSPSNPTGGVLAREQIQDIARMLEAYPEVTVLSDEIYSRMLYEGEHHSIAAEPGMRERTIILDGFSKTYAMTGWRLGYGVMPPALAQAVSQLQINCTSCVNAATQVAGIEALTGPQDTVDTMVAEFRARRDLIVAGLNQIPGVECVMPLGAFYAFPNVSRLPIGEGELAKRLLDEAGVAVLSGTAFGSYGKGYLRLSYANSQDNIRKALERMAEFVGAYASA
jgi:aspartate/methionine/tyrosine aminotransferase